MSVISLAKKTRIWINAVGGVVWGTGIGWVVAHYLLRHNDSLGLPHSSEPMWLKLHGASAFLALWTGGLMWGLHVVKAWKSQRQRVSGTALFSLLLILCMSGYLLYYVVDDDARHTVSLVHWILGAALPLIYLLHRIPLSSHRSGGK